MTLPAEPELPRILLAIPTGSIKNYCLLQMLASIRNIDYPVDRLDVLLAVTDRGDEDSAKFLESVNGLVAYADIPYPIQVISTTFTSEEFERWGGYVAVIKNLHEARKRFLDGDYDRFWLLGGDNPPLRDTLRRLLKTDADVVGAIINQRPERGRDAIVYDGKAFYEIKPDAVFPVYWGLNLRPKDIRARKDIDPVNRERLLQAFHGLCYFMLYGSKPSGVIRDVGFGSGCVVLKRPVLESIGYYLGLGGCHSEDIEFIQMSHLYGFDVALDTSTPCPHYDPNGAIY